MNDIQHFLADLAEHEAKRRLALPEEERQRLLVSELEANLEELALDLAQLGASFSAANRHNQFRVRDILIYHQVRLEGREVWYIVVQRDDALAQRSLRTGELTREATRARVLDTLRQVWGL